MKCLKCKNTLIFRKNKYSLLCDKCLNKSKSFITQKKYLDNIKNNINILNSNLSLISIVYTSGYRKLKINPLYQKINIIDIKSQQYKIIIDYLQKIIKLAKYDIKQIKKEKK